VVIEDSLPNTASGKFRWVVNEYRRPGNMKEAQHADARPRRPTWQDGPPHVCPGFGQENIVSAERAHPFAGVAMFRLHLMLASAAVTVVAAAVVITVPVAPVAEAAAPLFTGDYSTGDFSQWPSVQNRGYNGAGAHYVPTYSATVVNDSAKGKAARFEVRPGDVPEFGGGERSDVGSNEGDTGGTEGQTRWYQFSTMFDPTFPQNHADLGWGVTNGWHPNSSVGSSPFQWSVGTKDGYWSLIINKQSAPGTYLQTFSIFDTPLNVGQWHDVKMQVLFSTSDTSGWIRLWLGGVRQTFLNGADTYFVRTLIPGTTTVYYKEGMYRAPIASTDTVYHAGFRCADDEATL
jgi:hypothetical protein